jgi:toxin ParE1/3/4
MKAVYTAQALADLEAIADYLTPRTQQGARNVGAAIQSTIADLLVFPHAGRLQNAPGVRKIGTCGYPYLIYYAVDGEGGTITILTIQHGARQRAFDDT